MATRAAQAAATIAVGPEGRIAAALLEVDGDFDPVGTAAELCCAVDDVTDGETVVVPLTSAASSSGFCAKNCRV